MTNKFLENSTNPIEIVKLEDTYYIRDSIKNLTLIHDNMRNPRKVTNILDTIIYFSDIFESFL